MKKSRRSWRSWLVILSGLIMIWTGAQNILAHAILVSADPEPNGIVNAPPEEIWIRFSEPVEPAFSEIAVFSQSGQRIDRGDLTPANEDNTTLIVTLPPLAEGTYLVSWRVLSSVDGHTTSGTFPFGVGVGELSGDVGAVSSSAQQPTLFSAGGRWLTVTGVVLFLGMFTFYLFVWGPLWVDTEPSGSEIGLQQTVNRNGLKIGAVGLGLLGLGLLAIFVSQSTQYDLLNSENARSWLGTRFGAMWFIRSGLTLGAVLYLIYLFRVVDDSNVAGWLWGLGLAFATGLALTISLVSHSAALASDEALLALVVDLAHVLAASVWGGGLLQLGLGLWLVRRQPPETRRRLNWQMVFNFSTLAAIAVGVLLLSGGYLAWQHVGSWTLLFGTAYGLTLLTKIGLALPVFGIAASNLLWIKPRLDAALDAPDPETSRGLQKWFARLAQIETFFVLLVLIATGYLTDLQRGLDAPLLTNEPGRVLFQERADDLEVRLGLEPALVGQNSFEITLKDQAGQPVESAEEVSLRFTFLGQSMGTATTEAIHLGGGRYQAEGGYVSLVGPWQVEVTIRRPNTFDTFAPFRMEAGLNGAIRQFGRPSFLERLTKFLTQSGGSITGLGLILFALGWVFLAREAAQQDWQLLPLLLPGFVALWVGGLQLYTFYDEFTPAKFATNPILPDSGSIARGRQLYETNCAPCHGPQGLGDGEAAANIYPPPANFASGHTASHPDGDVFYWIKEGIADSAMPAFEDHLSEEDIWNLVNYIRRLSNAQPS